MKESKRNDYHIFHEEMFAKISGETGIDLSQKEVVVNYGSHSADFIKQFQPKLAELRIKMGEILYSKFKNKKIMKTGIELITEERQKQIDKHGFTAEHHAMHPEWYDKGQLIEAAHKLSFVMSNDETPENWDAEWFSNLCRRPHQERLIIAAALVASELDRLIYLINNNTDGRV